MMETSYSQTRAKQLSLKIDKISKIFNPSNFIKNERLDLQKLKDKINQAKNRRKTQYNTEENVLQEQKRRNIRPKINQSVVNKKRQNKNIDHSIQSNKKRHTSANQNLVSGIQPKFNPQSIKRKPKILEKKQQFKLVHRRKASNREDTQTIKQRRCYSRMTESEQQHQLPFCKFNRSRYLTKGNKNNYSSFSCANGNSGHQRKNYQRLQGKQSNRKLPTDLGQYQIDSRKHTSGVNSSFHNQKRIQFEQQHHNVRKKLQNLSVSRYTRFNTDIVQRKNNGNQASCQNIKSLMSAEIKTPRKILLGNHDKVQQFQFKILLLWELYEHIRSLTQKLVINNIVPQVQIIKYVRDVTTHKYQFIYDLCKYFPNNRIQRSIKISRILQNFSIFQLCLNGIHRKKVRQAEIINFLGYSSSSIIFVIRIFFLCHETPILYSERADRILKAITDFEQKSYQNKITNTKDILRRLEHNNQIINILKVRLGKKHGKYCEEFITQTIKNTQKSDIPFFETANNIFEFLSYHLHFENISYKLPMLATPPTPYLFLKYPKSIIIEPWGVLAYQKQDKLVIRTHTSVFLSKILNKVIIPETLSDSTTTKNQGKESQTVEITNDQKLIENNKNKNKLKNSQIAKKMKFNLIFWTQLMPKQADILASLFPQGQNVYWLYRYHCHQQPHKEQKNFYSRKKLNNSTEQNNYNYIKNIQQVGCLPQNTLMIDSSIESFRNNNENGIQLKWKGQKRDVKLLRLWDIIDKVSNASEQKKTSLVQEMSYYQEEIYELENDNKPKVFKRNRGFYRNKR